MVRPEQFEAVFGEGACVGHGRLAAAAKCLFPLGSLIIHEGALLLVEEAEEAGLVLAADSWFPSDKEEEEEPR